MTNTCSATLGSGALSLSGGYLTAAAVNLGMGGYAFSYADSQGGNGGTSSICLRTDAMCASGSTGTNANPSKDYGAGVGLNVNQALPATCGGAAGAINTFTVPTSQGLSYSLSNLPPGGMRVAIGNYDSTTGTGTDYCYPISAASGSIPWASFNSTCWTTGGTPFPGAGASITHIEFQLPTSASTQSFNFCVDSVGFAGSASTGCTSTAGQACSGSSCCTSSSGPSTGSGELTCYTFAQMGSAPISANTYKSFCGYTVTETSGGGNNNGACESGQLNYTDTVTANVGPNSEYFVAFPTASGGGWGNGAYCGMCVNITYNNQTQMATVVDECPTGSCTSNAGHLDMSAALARALGVGVGGATGDPTSGVSWKPVECPVTGNIKAVWNSVAGGQVYFQNVVWPVKSVTGGSCPGGGCTQTNGYWSGINQGTTVTLTDILGHTVSAVMSPPNSSGVTDTCVQFPARCN